MMLRLFAMWIPLALLMAGCASGPRFDPTGVARAVTPRQAVAEITALKGTRVLWGGVVVNSANLADATRIEVLAYPLGSSQEPNLAANPLGRFLVLKPGYLETADYGQGREVTVIGPLEGVRQGKVGQASYQYPVVSAERIHLWPGPSVEPRTRFHIGVGVIFGG